MYIGRSPFMMNAYRGKLDQFEKIQLQYTPQLRNLHERYMQGTLTLAQLKIRQRELHDEMTQRLNELKRKDKNRGKRK